MSRPITEQPLDLFIGQQPNRIEGHVDDVLTHRFTMQLERRQPHRAKHSFHLMKLALGQRERDVVQPAPLRQRRQGREVLELDARAHHLLEREAAAQTEPLRPVGSEVSLRTDSPLLPVRANSKTQVGAQPAQPEGTPPHAHPVVDEQRHEAVGRHRRGLIEPHAFAKQPRLLKVKVVRDAQRLVRPRLDERHCRRQPRRVARINW